MKFFKEFKDFALRGNVVDLAVGIIIGGAFGSIVSSLVADVIMPFMGVLIGGINFTELKILIHQTAEPAETVYINYGKFLQSVLDFTIIAFAIFLMVRTMNQLRLKFEKTPEPEAPVALEPTKEESLLTEIRDILKNKIN